jgi:hypothetical protein
MSRRRSNQPTISLFSFQDIVTSVTAILILVVLILTLELISRKYEAAASDPETQKRTTCEAVAELEALVNRISSEAASESQRGSGTSVPAIPESELRIMREQADRAVNQVIDARSINEKAKSLAQKALAAVAEMRAQSNEATEQERETALLCQETDKLAAENATERGRLETRQQELAGRPLPGPQLVFRRPPGTARRSWLLETSDTGFATLQLGTGTTSRLGPDSGDASRLVRWIATLQPNADYVLILSRPSGIDSSEKARARLKAVNIPHGLDFIGEEQSVHDGSLDDAPPVGAAGKGAGR